jgi:ABC-2 type transport system permease protein
MIALLRGEWLKMRTTVVPYALTAGALLINVLLIVGTFVNDGNTAPGLNSGGRLVSGGSNVPHTAEQLRNLVGTGFQAYIVALLFGVLCITTEFRHKTVTTTLLVTPRRSVFVAAKLAIAAALGAGLAVIMLAVSIGAGGAVLAARGGSFAALVGQMPAVAPGLILVFVLSAILGVGVGSIITNQAAAITVSLAWFFIADALVVNLAHGTERWVPTGAATALANLTRGVGADFGLFTWWQGGLLLVAYGAAFAGIGSVLLTHRDIA